MISYIINMIYDITYIYIYRYCIPMISFKIIHVISFNIIYIMQLIVDLFRQFDPPLAGSQWLAFLLQAE